MTDFAKFHADARTIQQGLAGPTDPPAIPGEDSIARAITAATQNVSLSPTEGTPAGTMSGGALAAYGVSGLAPESVELIRNSVRDRVAEARASAEQNIADAAAQPTSARGLIDAANNDIDAVRAGQQWLTLHGDETERDFYQAIDAADENRLATLAYDTPTRAQDFLNTVPWADAAYTALGQTPPVRDGIEWNSVMYAAQYADDHLPPELSTARLETQWVQTVSRVNTLSGNDLAQPLREDIAELDENLTAWQEGGVPPDSDEFYGIYVDAIARAAYHYGEPPISITEVATELRNVGLHVPSFDPDEVSRRLGVSPTSELRMTRVLDAESSQDAQETSPSNTLVDVASARMNVRRALVSIEQDSTTAQQHLQAANKALNSVVEELRPSDAREEVAAAHESVRQASANVEAIAETTKEVASTDAPETEQATRDAEAEVTIYTTPDCTGCDATKRSLDKAGVTYDAIDLSERPDLVETFKQQGLMQSPIVETQDGERWSGFNPGKLKEHGLDYRSRQQRGGPGPETGHGR